MCLLRKVPFVRLVQVSYLINIQGNPKGDLEVKCVVYLVLGSVWSFLSGEAALVSPSRASASSSVSCSAVLRRARTPASGLNLFGLRVTTEPSGVSSAPTISTLVELSSMLFLVNDFQFEFRKFAFMQT